MQTILSFLSSFFSNAEYFVPTMWVTLGCIVTWLLFTAKRHQAITPKEVEMLWKSHKQFKRCSARTFTEIIERKKIIGYICQCGHEHKQERPIINIKN